MSLVSVSSSAAAAGRRNRLAELKQKQAAQIQGAAPFSHHEEDEDAKEHITDFLPSLNFGNDLLQHNKKPGYSHKSSSSLLSLDNDLLKLIFQELELASLENAS